MIWHFLEIWGLLLAVFVAGCLIGTLVYSVVAAGPLATAQEELVEAVGDAVAGVRSRLGLAERRFAEEEYRPSVRPRRRYDQPPAAMPLPEGKATPAWDAAQDDEELNRADEMTDEALDTHPEAAWEGEQVWEEEEEVADEIEVDLAAPVESAPVPIPPASPPVPVTAEAEPDLPAMRPLTLPGPRNSVPDNLQKIRGIGQKNEELLNSLGIFHFGQIAAWTPAEARWIGSHLAFPERIERDDWVGQAIILATGGSTGHVKAANRKKVAEEEEEPPTLGPAA